jgi:NAD(P)-dependent dehydrogenase (short-subunit alcohol dehydrogenase family)
LTEWTLSEMPSQVGKVAVVTGTGGLGYEMALALVGKGAHVVLAGRNAAKGHESIARIRARFPPARIEFGELDLASLASVEGFAKRFAGTHAALDLLINNAGLMAPPTRLTTADGFELQFGTNYLGHFALSAHLLPQLRGALAPRVVAVSSNSSRWGAIDFDDLHAERRRYWASKSYAQSMLAKLLFAFELQRRSDTNGWNIRSIASHPGFARTNLIANGSGTDGWRNKLSEVLKPFVTHSAAAGALPALFAATSPDAVGGGYYGPDGFFELKGSVAPAYVPPAAKDTAVARRLWDVSERLASVSFENSESTVERGMNSDR